jgi:hypothetical protein
MEDIVDDALCIIFSFFTVVARVLNRRVCRRWFHLITSNHPQIKWRGDYIDCCATGAIFSLISKEGKKYYEDDHIRTAVRSNSWDVVKYYWKTSGRTLMELENSYHIIGSACLYGYDKLARCIIMCINFNIKDVLRCIIRGGNVRLMKWFYRRHKDYIRSNMELGHLHSACISTNIRMVKFISGLLRLHDNPYPLDKCCEGGLVSFARRSLSKEIVPPILHKHIWMSVGIGGSFDIITLLNKTYPIEYDALCVGAIRGGHINILNEYIGKVKIPITRGHLQQALESHNIEIVRVVLERVDYNTLIDGHGVLSWKSNKLLSDTNVTDRIYYIRHVQSELPLLDIVYDRSPDNIKEAYGVDMSRLAAIMDYVPLLEKCLVKENIIHLLEIARVHKSYAAISYLESKLLT